MNEQQPEVRHQSNEPTIARRWNVVLDAHGTKRVIQFDHPLAPGESIVASRPHEDGDFSYLCPIDHCRCQC